jgi:fumarate reductase subunit C
VSATPRVDAMRPRRAGPTRTAPPRPPDQFPTRGRYRAYVLFGLCGGFLLVSGLLLLRVVWALGSGAAAYRSVLGSFGHPLYLAYHALALVGLVWFTLRFFGLFPKSQPPRIGPLRPPPDAVIAVLLYSAFAVTTLLLLLVLTGVIP